MDHRAPGDAHERSAHWRVPRSRACSTERISQGESGRRRRLHGRRAHQARVDQENRRDRLVNYWDNLAHHADEQIWMAHPLVRRAINERVSGDPDIWPITALRVRLGRTARSALSIGCGTGGLERSIVDENISHDVTGIDISEAPLAEARRLAGDRPIQYRVADAWSFLRENAFDAIFFHGSLHHFDRLDELMELVARALRPNGFLWYDE